MNVKEIKKGAVLAYVLIVVNTLYGLFFTPFLILHLGDGEYGVYKIISSFVGSMTVLDLGIGSTMLRYTAKFYAHSDYESLNNFFAMGMIQAAILSAVMLIVSVIMYGFIDSAYGNSLTPGELSKAKQLFVLFTAILVLSTFEKVIFGVISGCEHYAFANFMKLFRIAGKVILSYLILSRIADSAYLLYIEIFLLVFTMIVQILYIGKTAGVKIKYDHWDMKLFKSSLKYTVLMFIQSLAVQFNGNLDNMVIGSIVSAAAVTVYSIGLQLYNMYEQFALAFSDMLLPTVSKQVAEGANNRQLENTVIKIGRLEFTALGAALCGFIIIGKEFITLWLGESYTFAWVVGVILMIPTTVPLIQNVCLSILRAQNKMQFRTWVVCIMALFNLVVTIVGVRFFGPLAACVGTAVGLIGANIIAMNIYYVKIIGLNIFRVFKEILSRTWLCCLIASGALYISDTLIQHSSWLFWIIKVFIFVLVYGITLLAYGFNKSEKEVLLGRVFKLFRGRRSA